MKHKLKPLANPNMVEMRYSSDAYISLHESNAEIRRLKRVVRQQKKSGDIKSLVTAEQSLQAMLRKRKSDRGQYSGKVAYNTFTVLVVVIMIVYCLSLFVLPLWMVGTSFKDDIQYTRDKFGLPPQVSFENYRSVFEKLQIKIDYFTTYNMLDMAGFSIIHALSTSLIKVFFTVCMAYVIAKYKFFGRNLIYGIGIFVMIVPIIGSLPSAMRVNKELHIHDNMALMILTSPGTACFSGLNFLLLYGAFKSIPWDYAEAVFVDGGNHYTAFFKMYLPMILPSAMVIFILSFLGAWNDYMTFMMWLPSTPNLAYGLYLFQGSARALYKSSITEIMAGFTIVVIPTMILYLCSQKLILAKFTVGGLKG